MLKISDIKIQDTVFVHDRGEINKQGTVLSVKFNKILVQFRHYTKWCTMEQISAKADNIFKD